MKPIFALLISCVGLTSAVAADKPLFVAPSAAAHVAIPVAVSLAGDKTSVAIGEGVSEIAVSVKNVSQSEVSITHAGVSSVLAPIAPLVIPSGQSKTVTLLVDGKTFYYTSNLGVYFRLVQGTDISISAFPLNIVSNDVVSLDAQGAAWQVGEEAKPKVVRIARVPSGTKVTGVSVSSSDFTARLDGTSIIVTPKDTKAIHQGAVTVTTEPAGRGSSQFAVFVVAGGRKS